MALEQFSTANITNSFGLAIGTMFLAKGYLIYWHQIDAVQTPTMWYHEYSAQQAAYLANPLYAAEVAAAKGLITLRADISALPRFVVRHTVDGTVSGPEEVPVPAISIEVAAMNPRSRYELGTGLRWRIRPFMLIALARDPDEQGRFTDWLSEMFDEDAHFTIYDHDAATQAEVGSVRVDQVTNGRATATDDAEALTYQVLVNAFLEYVA